MLSDVERHYPAPHYIMIDDKLGILTAMKKVWRGKLTTVFPRQGHYALDPRTSHLTRGRTSPSRVLTNSANYDLPALLHAAKADRLQ